MITSTLVSHFSGFECLAFVLAFFNKSKGSPLLTGLNSRNTTMAAYELWRCSLYHSSLPPFQRKKLSFFRFELQLAIAKTNFLLVCCLTFPTNPDPILEAALKRVTWFSAWWSNASVYTTRHQAAKNRLLRCHLVLRFEITSSLTVTNKHPTSRSCPVLTLFLLTCHWEHLEPPHLLENQLWFQ